MTDQGTLKIKYGDVELYCNIQELDIRIDFVKLKREEFFKKYPHLKPEYPKAKVTLDEKDK